MYRIEDVPAAFNFFIQFVVAGAQCRRCQFFQTSFRFSRQAFRPPRLVAFFSALHFRSSLHAPRWFF